MFAGAVLATSSASAAAALSARSGATSRAAFRTTLGTCFC